MGRRGIPKTKNESMKGATGQLHHNNRGKIVQGELQRNGSHDPTLRHPSTSVHSQQCDGR